LKREKKKKERKETTWIPSPHNALNKKTAIELLLPGTTNEGHA
jgi:hypothetical protein